MTSPAGRAGAPAPVAPPPVLAEVIRSGFAESRHRGAVVVLGPDGRILHHAGEVTTPIFPRSVNKPLQAAAMLRAGLDLDGPLLALAAASHTGEDFHVAGVRRILARAGLSARDLRCPPGWPQEPPPPSRRAAARRLVRGGNWGRLWATCSGKHAAMLATCVRAGWPTASYPDPEHPLQQEIRRTVAGLAGEPVSLAGVDGCGAPLFALSLAGLARGLQAVASAPAPAPERRVADAMRAHPEWTSGSRTGERALMAAVPGLLFKSGAEGVGGMALGDGRAAAFKIDDGSARAVTALAAALARWLGACGPDAAGLDRIAAPPVYGGGRVVGEIRVTLPW